MQFPREAAVRYSLAQVSTTFRPILPRSRALYTLRYGRDMHSVGKPAKYAAVRCWRLSVTRSVCVCVCVLQTAAPAILVSVLPRDQKGDSQLDWGLGTAQAQWVESALRCSATCRSEQALAQRYYCSVVSLLGPAIERAWPSTVRSTLLWKPLTPRTAAVGLLLQRTED